MGDDDPIKEVREIFRRYKDAKGVESQASLLVGIYKIMRMSASENEAMRESCKLYIHFLSAFLELRNLFKK